MSGNVKSVSSYVRLVRLSVTASIYWPVPPADEKCVKKTMASCLS